MTFQEIFDSPGIYIHRDMREGIAARVDDMGAIDFVEYETPTQVWPNTTIIRAYKQCFQKDWKKVASTYQLFGTKRHELLNERTK